MFQIRRDLLHSGDNSNALINELRALLRDSHVQVCSNNNKLLSKKVIYVNLTLFQALFCVCKIVHLEKCVCFCPSVHVIYLISIMECF